MVTIVFLKNIKTYFKFIKNLLVCIHLYPIYSKFVCIGFIIFTKQSLFLVKNNEPVLSPKIFWATRLPWFLEHPKIKLFITQGGLQSTDEAITAGVPIIGMPMLGDQWYNIERHEYHKTGIGLDMETLNEEILTKAINTVIEDPRLVLRSLSKPGKQCIYVINWI